MNFTFASYAQLLTLLRNADYKFCDYHTWNEEKRCVILRHDIDQSIEAAVKLAHVEQAMGVHSTWFVMLTSDFYNPASPKNLEGLRMIQSMGHELGLHFDEVAYVNPQEPVEKLITHEVGILSEILQTPVTTVSMHRPSQKTLDANLQIPGIINSYGNEFLCEFKYLSDSRRHWHEPVEEIVRSGEYDRLHILTHAFWYHEQEKSMGDAVQNFVDSAKHERYEQLVENISNLESVIREEDA